MRFASITVDSSGAADSKVQALFSAASASTSTSGANDRVLAGGVGAVSGVIGLVASDVGRVLCLYGRRCNFLYWCTSTGVCSDSFMVSQEGRLLVVLLGL